MIWTQSAPHLFPSKNTRTKKDDCSKVNSTKPNSGKGNDSGKGSCVTYK